MIAVLESIGRIAQGVAMGSAFLAIAAYPFALLAAL